MPSHVDVTVVAERRRVDLRIPTRITVHRLVQELSAVLAAGSARKHQIAVPAKGLLLTEENVVCHYSVTDGDVLELVGGTDGER